MSCCRKRGLLVQSSEKQQKQRMKAVNTGRTEIPEISEKCSSEATRTTHGHSREAIRKGLHVKLGFLLACGLPQTPLQAETYSGDSDLLSCLEERRELKDAQSLITSLVTTCKDKSKLTFSSYHCHADSAQR